MAAGTETEQGRLDLADHAEAEAIAAAGVEPLPGDLLHLGAPAASLLVALLRAD
jgi:hypothetical protein